MLERMNTMKNFNGGKLKKLIEKTGLNTLAFSKDIKLNQSRIEFSINGYRPSDEVIQTFCTYFDVPLDYFDDAKEDPTTIKFQQLIKDSGKKLVEISAESGVSEATIRMLMNSTSFSLSKKNITKLQHALDKKEQPLTYIEKKLMTFANERFDGNIEKAKEYIFHYYFDQQQL